MRLIDADALIEKLDELERYVDCDENLTTWIQSDEVYNAIDNAPTVPIPVDQNVWESGYECGKNERPQGKWIVKSNGITNHYACDKCGSAGDIQDKFCRECGAKMKGD